MSTVVVTIVTKEQAFTGGEVDGPFTYMIRSTSDPAGFADRAQKSTDVTSTFTDVPTGEYIAVVSKLGVEVTATFSVGPGEGTTFSVPDTVTVEVFSETPPVMAGRAAQKPAR